MFWKIRVSNNYKENQFIIITFSSRCIQLASIFMSGIENAIIANDACGSPVPWEFCCPWNFFDGKLFHTKWLQATMNFSVIDLCEGKVLLHTNFGVKKICNKNNKKTYIFIYFNDFLLLSSYSESKLKCLCLYFSHALFGGYFLANCSLSLANFWSNFEIILLQTHLFIWILSLATYCREIGTSALVCDRRSGFKVLYQRFGANQEVLQPFWDTRLNAIHTLHGDHTSSSRCTTHEGSTLTRYDGRKTDGAREWWYPSCKCQLFSFTLASLSFVYLPIVLLWLSVLTQCHRKTPHSLCSLAFSFRNLPKYRKARRTNGRFDLKLWGECFLKVCLIEAFTPVMKTTGKKKKFCHRYCLEKAVTIWWLLMTTKKRWIKILKEIQEYQTVCGGGFYILSGNLRKTNFNFTIYLLLLFPSINRWQEYQLLIGEVTKPVLVTLNTPHQSLLVDPILSTCPAAINTDVVGVDTTTIGAVVVSTIKTTTTMSTR